MPETPCSDRLIALPEVREMTGLGTTSIYKFQKTAGFPHPRQLGGKAVRWSAREVADWIERQPRTRPEASAPANDA